LKGFEGWGGGRGKIIVVIFELFGQLIYSINCSFGSFSSFGLLEKGGLGRKRHFSERHAYVFLHVVVVFVFVVVRVV